MQSKSFFCRLLLVLLAGTGWFGGTARAVDVVVSQQMLDTVAERYGDAARNRLADWNQLIETNQDSAEQDKLALVNDFFNQNLAEGTDQDNWGTQDYWATPVEMLVAGSGDSEDFAIAKYFTLKRLGLADATLLVTYTRATVAGGIQARMVLLYTPAGGATSVVLDNLQPDILPMAERTDLRFVYGVNETGMFIVTPDGPGQRAGDDTRVSLWVDMKTRIEDGALGR